MARVIKGNQTSKPAARRPVPKLRSSGDRKVIEKEVWEAQQEAGRIMEAAEAERERLVQEGRIKANQAREEAQAEGAQEAFEEAAQEALAAFRRRAERFQEAADDIKVLAHEVARKILGSNLQLESRRVDRIIEEGMSQLRAKRKLRIQMPEERRQALIQERPILMDALASEPDLLIEPAEDVSPGRARIVTEIGGALCSEQRALDSLAEALNVDEKAVAPRPQSAVHDRLHEAQTGRVALEASGAELAYDDSSEEEATQFLQNAQAVARSAASGEASPRRRKMTPEELEERRARKKAAAEAQARAERRKQRKKKQEADRTLALDVSSLREELNRGEDPSDDLDLFADDAVLE